MNKKKWVCLTLFYVAYTGFITEASYSYASSVSSVDRQTGSSQIGVTPVTQIVTEYSSRNDFSSFLPRTTVPALPVFPHPPILLKLITVTERVQQARSFCNNYFDFFHSHKFSEARREAENVIKILDPLFDDYMNLNAPGASPLEKAYIIKSYALVSSKLSQGGNTYRFSPDQKQRLATLSVLVTENFCLPQGVGLFNKLMPWERRSVKTEYIASLRNSDDSRYSNILLYMTLNPLGRAELYSFSPKQQAYSILNSASKLSLNNRKFEGAVLFSNFVDGVSGLYLLDNLSSAHMTMYNYYYTLKIIQERGDRIDFFPKIPVKYYEHIRKKCLTRGSSVDDNLFSFRKKLAASTCRTPIISDYSSSFRPAPKRIYIASAEYKCELRSATTFEIEELLRCCVEFEHDLVPARVLSQKINSEALLIESARRIVVLCQKFTDDHGMLLLHGVANDSQAKLISNQYARALDILITKDDFFADPFDNEHVLISPNPPFLQKFRVALHVRKLFMPLRARGKTVKSAISPDFAVNYSSHCAMPSLTPATPAPSSSMPGNSTISRKIIPTVPVAPTIAKPLPVQQLFLSDDLVPMPKDNVESLLPEPATTLLRIPTIQTTTTTTEEKAVEACTGSSAASSFSFPSPKMSFDAQSPSLLLSLSPLPLPPLSFTPSFTCTTPLNMQIPESPRILPQENYMSTLSPISPFLSDDTFNVATNSITDIPDTFAFCHVKSTDNSAEQSSE